MPALPPPPPPPNTQAIERPTEKLMRLNGSSSILESSDSTPAVTAASASSEKVRRTLRDALQRVHCQLEDLGCGESSAKIAQATTPLGTRMALAAFTMKDLGLEEDDDDDGQRRDARRA